MARARSIQAGRDMHQTRAAFIPLLAAVIARVPIRIYHVHGTPYLGYRRLLRAVLWMLDLLNCRFATHVIAVSPSIRDCMIRDGVVRTKVPGVGAGFFRMVSG